MPPRSTTPQAPGIGFTGPALGGALAVALLVAYFGFQADPERGVLPLLLLLLMAEFGALLAAAGAIHGALRLRRGGFAWPLGLATVLCVAIALALMRMGWLLWPGV